ncbi:TPA: ATP-dependent helicase, partial [Streptococcus pyogenes]
CPECGHENELTKREIEEIKEAELQEISEQKQLKLKNRVSTYQTPDMCQTMDELTEYRKQHGYKPGWQYYIAKKLGILY